MPSFDGFFEAVALLLAWFYELPVVGGSYGIAIILLTLTVMVLLMPLTLKATRSTIKMQQLQPEMKRVQKQYKDDREEMNRQLMALYSEHGINPVGGCVPMLLQLPVFLVLFRVLQGLTRRVSERPFFESANQLRDGAPVAADSFDPRYVTTDSEIYQDLSQTSEMTFGPFDLAEQAGDLVQSDFLRSIPYLILIAFVVGSSYFQQKQVSARRGNDSSPMNQQQQILLRVLPLMTGVWSFFFPAGLVVYWATSNLFRIGQQSYITRQIYEREGATEKLAEARKKAEQEEKKNKKKANASGSDKKNSDKKNSDRENSGSKKGDSDTTGNGATSNGSKNNKKKTDNGSKNGDADRELTKAEKNNEAWKAQRQKAASKKKRSSTSAQQSSRVTPKGTAPSRSKKKKK